MEIHRFINRSGQVRAGAPFEVKLEWMRRRQQPQPGPRGASRTPEPSSAIDKRTTNPNRETAAIQQHRKI